MTAFLPRCSETDDLVLLAMIRPEIFAVERQRTRMKGNSSEIFRRSCDWIEASEPVVSGVFVIGCHQIELSIEDDLAADLMRCFEFGQDSAVVIQAQDSLVVPLAQVQLLTIKPEL